MDMRVAADVTAFVQREVKTSHRQSVNRAAEKQQYEQIAS